MYTCPTRPLGFRASLAHSRATDISDAFAGLFKLPTSLCVCVRVRHVRFVSGPFWLSTPTVCSSVSLDGKYGVSDLFIGLLELSHHYGQVCRCPCTPVALALTCPLQLHSIGYYCMPAMTTSTAMAPISDVDGRPSAMYVPHVLVLLINLLHYYHFTQWILLPNTIGQFASDQPVMWSL